MTIVRQFNRGGRNEVGYTYDQPTTLDEAWELIKKERLLRVLEGGYKVGQHWYHSDHMSRIQQMGLLLLGANIPAGLMWKTMSGVMVPMTQSLAQQVFLAAAQQDAALFAAGEQHWAAAQNADLSTYNFQANWPQAYWES